MKIDWSNIFFAVLVIIMLVCVVSWFFGFDIPNYNEIKKEMKKSNPIFETGQTCSKAIEDCKNRYDPYSESYCEGDKALVKRCESFCIRKSVELNLRLSYKSYECNEEELLICNC